MKLHTLHQSFWLGKWILWPSPWQLMYTHRLWNALWQNISKVVSLTMPCDLAYFLLQEKTNWFLDFLNKVELSLNVIWYPTQVLWQKVVFCTQMHGRKDIWRDRQANSSIPQKTIILTGYIKGNGRKHPQLFFLMFSTIFSNIEAFKCKTTSDWLNHIIWPIRNSVTFKILEHWRKKKECSGESLMNTDPGSENEYSIFLYEHWYIQNLDRPSGKTWA